MQVVWRTEQAAGGRKGRDGRYEAGRGRRGVKVKVMEDVDKCNVVMRRAMKYYHSLHV